NKGLQYNYNGRTYELAADTNYYSSQYPDGVNTVELHQTVVTYQANTTTTTYAPASGSDWDFVSASNDGSQPYTGIMANDTGSLAYLASNAVYAEPSASAQSNGSAIPVIPTITYQNSKTKAIATVQNSSSVSYTCNQTNPGAAGAYSNSCIPLPGNGSAPQESSSSGSSLESDAKTLPRDNSSGALGAFVAGMLTSVSPGIGGGSQKTIGKALALDDSADRYVGSCIGEVNQYFSVEGG
ncbi:MAG: hypothetical protein AB8B70_08705, partial [Prochlorococcus sp.]